jgi:hypothetical protein
MAAEERRQVSAWRKVAFYAGYISMAAGLLIFIGVMASFLTLGLSFTPSSLVQRFLSALLGMALLALGGFLRRIGILGLAGSVVILDPPQARADLEPWSRAAGGLVDSALSEVSSVQKVAAGAGSEKVKVRCPSCKALNDEVARFCNQCAAAL